MNPRDLTEDDRISVDTDGLSGVTSSEPTDSDSVTESSDSVTFRVSDVEVTNIGIAETVAVTLLCGCDRYAITGVTSDSTYTLEHLDGDDEWTIFQQDIEYDD